MTYNQVKKTIARKKNKQYPKIPQTLKQLGKEFSKPKILNEYGFNLEGDARFYVGTKITKEYEFIVFYSDYVMNFIKEKIPIGSRYYLMDGTFGSLPKGLYQLLTISIAYEENVSASKSLFHTYLPPDLSTYFFLSVRPPVRPQYISYFFTELSHQS